MSGKHRCYYQIAVILLNFLWGIVLCATQNLCFQCSDPNIEVHVIQMTLILFFMKLTNGVKISYLIMESKYFRISFSMTMQCMQDKTRYNESKHYGAFFNNPRVLQDDSRGNEQQPRCESEKTARIQMCRDPCYTLNVTTFDIKTKRLLSFGMSHGCSTLILLSSRIRSNDCYHSNILLKTTPVYPLQTQYCFCSSDACNVIRPTNAMMRVGASRFKGQESGLITHNYAIVNITSGSTTKSMHLFGIFLLLFALIKYYLYLPIVF